MMNETLKVLETRRSCRSFKPDMITDEELQAVLRAGSYAPSCRGKQSTITIVLTNKELRAKLAAVNAKIRGNTEDFDPFYGAPVILIVLADKNATGGDNHKYDGSLVLGNMFNAATSIGLGSIWINRAKQEFEMELGKEILRSLGIEGDYEGVGHCALGYIDKPLPPPAPRKPNSVYYIK